MRMVESQILSCLWWGGWVLCFKGHLVTQHSPPQVANILPHIIWETGSNSPFDNFQTLTQFPNSYAHTKKTRIISISNVLFDPANHTLKTVKNPPLLLYLEVPLMDHYNVSWCQFLSLWSRCKFIDRLILKLTDVLFFPPPPSLPPPHTFPILSLFSSTERRDAQLPTNKSQTGG